MRNRLFSLIATLFIVNSIYSCESSQTTLKEYNDQFISFNFPEDWFINRIDTSQSSIRKYILEKGKNDASLLTIMIISDAVNDKAAYIMMDFIDQTYKDVSYSEESRIEFLQKPTFMYTYSFSSALHYIGAVFAVQNGNDVLLINYQFENDHKEQSLIQVHKILDSISLTMSDK
jgi:hypothetical protein